MILIRRTMQITCQCFESYLIKFGENLPIPGAIIFFQRFSLSCLFFVITRF